MKTAAISADASSGATQTRAQRSMGALIADLVKARLTFLVLVTTLVGFCMGLDRGSVSYWVLLSCMLGTALCAAGAAAWNQWIEREADARMNRTRSRPLPTGEMKPATAAAIGTGACLAGLALLWTQVNWLAAVVALLTIFSYVLLYTPLKRLTSLNTLVGAIPGALPPVIGYVASANRLDWVAAALFTILFLWQLPHFLAISWLYREDYLKGGFKMISGRDPSGRETSWKAVAYTLMLIASTCLPYFLRTNSLIWLVGSLLLGFGFLFYAVRFLGTRDASGARKLFYASIIYLPVLLGLMVFTRL